jgi:hypothetical protein
MMIEAKLLAVAPPQVIVVPVSPESRVATSSPVVGVMKPRSCRSVHPAGSIVCVVPLLAVRTAPMTTLGGEGRSREDRCRGPCRLVLLLGELGDACDRSDRCGTLPVSCRRT